MKGINIKSLVIQPTGDVTPKIFEDAIHSSVHKYRVREKTVVMATSPPNLVGHFAEERLM